MNALLRFVEWFAEPVPLVILAIIAVLVFAQGVLLYMEYLESHRGKR